MQREFLKEKISPMTYLNDKILKSFFFYSTTTGEVIKIIKSFFNTKSVGPNSLHHLYWRIVLM